MLSTYTLILRQNIGQRNNMAKIAVTRQMDTTRAWTSMLNELKFLADNLDQMTNIHVHDEATSEDSLRENSVLGKGSTTALKTTCN